MRDKEHQREYMSQYRNTNKANIKIKNSVYHDEHRSAILRRQKLRYDTNKDRERLRHVWIMLKQRCLNPLCADYHYYGGRGITICTEWMDFTCFKSWAYSNGYISGLTIDRVDNDGDYTSANCQWITKSANTAKRNRIYFSK